MGPAKKESFAGSASPPMRALTLIAQNVFTARSANGVYPGVVDMFRYSERSR